MASSRRKWLLLMAVAGTATLALHFIGDRGRVDTGLWQSAPADVQAVMWPVQKPVAAFTMRTQHGGDFGREQLLGQWNFVAFGFLQCPDVCPTTLQTLKQMRRLMAQPGQEPGERFLFVTVDPHNDSAERLGPYLAYFDPAFVGLVGDDEQLAGFARSTAAMYAESRDSRGVRSMDHTTSIIVIDPAGNVVASLPMPAEPQRLLDQYRRLRAHLEG